MLPPGAYVYTLMKVGSFRINLHPSKSNREQMLCCVSTALRMQGNLNHLPTSAASQREIVDSKDRLS